MLVLSRKAGESIKIGNAVVRVMGIAGSVRIGIEAPKDVRIVRGELGDEGPDGKGPSALPKAA